MLENPCINGKSQANLLKVVKIYMPLVTVVVICHNNSLLVNLSHLNTRATLLCKMCMGDSFISLSQDSLRLIIRHYFASSMQETISVIRVICAITLTENRTFLCHKIKWFHKWMHTLDNKCYLTHNNRHLIPHYLHSHNSNRWWNQICMEIGSSKRNHSNHNQWYSPSKSFSSQLGSRFLFNIRTLTVV
jgi:hypothetical protein